jgi:16S rRNA processing protein RimM
MDLFEIGRILKPRGLKGQMRCFSYLESDELRKSLKEVRIIPPEGEPQSYRLRDISFAGKFFFLSLDGVDTQEKAQKLAGAEILAAVSVLAPLGDGEYYWHDIIGLDVVTEEGQTLGQVKEIFSTGSNDVYVCRNGEQEVLLPAIADVICRIDLVEKRMVVHLLEGL